MKHLWFDRLERRLGFLAIPGLASFIVGMNVAIWVLSMLRPEFTYRLVLDPNLVMHGEVWRVFTFLFIPPRMAALFKVFWLMLLYTFASALEKEWGDFHFTLYYGIGAAASVAGAFIIGDTISNVTLNSTIFLAFAALYPDFELMLFFFLPVKVKWLAWLSWAGIALGLIAGDAGSRVALATGIANYALFFGPAHWERLKLWIHHQRNRGKFG